MYFHQYLIPTQSKKPLSLLFLFMTYKIFLNRISSARNPSQHEKSPTPTKVFQFNILSNFLIVDRPYKKFQQRISEFFPPNP